MNTGLAESPCLFGLCWIAAALLLFLASSVLAQDADAVLQIETAFLHKFPTYVEAPGTAFDDRATPLIFGIAGSERVYDLLAELAAAQNSEVRAIEVRRVAGMEDLAGVHVLFIGNDAGAAAGALLQRGVATSMLTVTGVPGPQPANSMIHFFVADDRVRFDIALAPAEAAGLRLSSRLLQVARQVTGSPTAPGD